MFKEKSRPQAAHNQENFCLINNIILSKWLKLKQATLRNSAILPAQV
jgi:hypothetical protein